jgi:hypothetical protein
MSDSPRTFSGCYTWPAASFCCGVYEMASSFFWHEWKPPARSADFKLTQYGPGGFAYSLADRAFDSQSDSQTDGRGRKQLASANSQSMIFLKKTTLHQSPNSSSIVAVSLRGTAELHLQVDDSRCHLQQS